MTELWFKRRRYGWGWTPASPRGWQALIGFLVAVLGGAAVLALTSPEGNAWPVVAYLAWVLIAALALIRITRAHGPAPRWRWGHKPDDNPAEDY